MGTVRNSWILDISKAKTTEFADELDVACEERTGI